MSANRSRKAAQNVTAGFLYELVNLVCGLILPRLILQSFGSAYNGLTSSISQFISVIALMKSGIGGVTRAALYKPLAEHDDHAISEILMSTERYMRRIALIFILGVTVFAAIYPLWIVKDFEWFFSFSLVMIISISTFMQYYFGLTYQMLLNADQKGYVSSFVQIITTILNTVIASVLILCGASIHVVKLGSALAFAVNPILINRYAYKHYNIDRTVKPNMSRISQRWDALGHEVANFINNNTDIMVLTVFIGVKEVSVYTVYTYVIHAIRKVVVNFTTSFGAAFGNMYAKQEFDLMHENLGIFELMVFSITSIVYSVTLVMITPFSVLYTHGVHDISYYRPIFGYVIVLASAFTCYRIPYYMIVTSAGHYKQTRNGAFMEAIINIALSIAMVIKLGLVGVAIGTLAAAIFRSTQYAIYMGKNILVRPIRMYLLHVFVSLGTMAATFGVGSLFFKQVDTIPIWIVKAVILTLFAGGITVGVDLLLWREDCKNLMRKGKGIFRKRKKKTT